MVASRSAPHIHHFHEPDDEFTALSLAGERRAPRGRGGTSLGVVRDVPWHARGYTKPRRVHTAPGSSNPLRYSRPRYWLASLSSNVSVFGSKRSFLPVRQAMLPMWHMTLETCPCAI